MKCKTIAPWATALRERHSRDKTRTAQTMNKHNKQKIHSINQRHLLHVQGFGVTSSSSDAFARCSNSARIPCVHYKNFKKQTNAYTNKHIYTYTHTHTYYTYTYILHIHIHITHSQGHHNIDATTMFMKKYIIVSDFVDLKMLTHEQRCNRHSVFEHVQARRTDKCIGDCCQMSLQQ